MSKKNSFVKNDVIKNIKDEDEKYLIIDKDHTQYYLRSVAPIDFHDDYESVILDKGKLYAFGEADLDDINQNYEKHVSPKYRSHKTLNNRRKSRRYRSRRKGGTKKKNRK